MFTFVHYFIDFISSHISLIADIYILACVVLAWYVSFTFMKTEHELWNKIKLRMLLTCNCKILVAKLTAFFIITFNFVLVHSDMFSVGVYLSFSLSVLLLFNKIHFFIIKLMVALRKTFYYMSMSLLLITSIYVIVNFFYPTDYNLFLPVLATLTFLFVESDFHPLDANSKSAKAYVDSLISNYEIGNLADCIRFLLKAENKEFLNIVFSRMYKLHCKP